MKTDVLQPPEHGMMTLKQQRILSWHVKVMHT